MENKALREMAVPVYGEVSAYPACIAFIYGQARMRYNDEEFSP